MSNKHNERPVFSENNKAIREREITEWVNRKLDDELVESMDEEHQRLAMIEFLKWCAERDEDQSSEAFALRAAETGDLTPLRELYPRLAKYLNPPKKENRGGDRRTETAKREAKGKYERSRLVLFDYRRIMKLLKDHEKRPSALAVRIAAARWADLENASTTEKASALQHKLETELEQALRHSSDFDL